LIDGLIPSPGGGQELMTTFGSLIAFDIGKPAFLTPRENCDASVRLP